MRGFLRDCQFIMRILIYMPHGRGGIVDYTHDQANALHELGCEIDCLCPPSYADGRLARYRLRPELRESFPNVQSSLRILRQLRLSLRILQNSDRLVRAIKQGKYEFVLMHFSEYLAPFWAPRLRRLQASGVTFASVLHDPVRGYVVGPRRWHDWSVRQAFSFLSTVFVHSEQELPTTLPINSVVIPYGIHVFPEPNRSREAVRQALDLPVDAKVLLAAGFIRDSKNLDLVLRAMATVPEVYLIVAGTDQSGGNKPASYYQALSSELGCADRCRWILRFIDPVERANLFAASDLCVLTYSSSFRSASSALSGAANYRLPSIVSSGPSSMEVVVKGYNLGVWVEPDLTEAIKAGLQLWLSRGISPDWQRYFADYSWSENARRVIAAMSGSREKSPAGFGRE